MEEKIFGGYCTKQDLKNKGFIGITVMILRATIVLHGRLDLKFKSMNKELMDDPKNKIIPKEEIAKLLEACGVTEASKLRGKIVLGYPNFDGGLKCIGVKC